LVRREGREVAGCGGIRAVPPGRLAARWGRRKEGERVRLTGRAQVSVSARKKKRRRLGGPLRGGLVGRQAGLGRKGRRVCFLFFLFFFFKLLFKQLFFSNSNQILSNFFSEIL
jgi:hypothetical protein